ncbi:MAG: CvpA family protein [Flammeovirgaceae bacterium]|nr:CvpA family protein [Flammeovirgaceae bacterium]
MSFLLIFLIVVVAVTFIGGRIKNSMDKTFLGKMDAAAGAVLGLLKYAFSLSIILWLIDSFKISLPESWVSDSKLYPIVAHVAPTIASFLEISYHFSRKLSHSSKVRFFLVTYPKIGAYVLTGKRRR